MRKAVNALKTTTDLTDLSVTKFNTLVLAASDFKFTFIWLFTPFIFHYCYPAFQKYVPGKVTLHGYIFIFLSTCLGLGICRYFFQFPASFSPQYRQISVWKLFLTSTPRLRPPCISQDNLSCYCAELYLRPLCLS